MNAIGDDMFRWATELFPMPRSLSGNGVRSTLAYLQKILPELRVIEVPSGTRVFDWEIPDEWNVREAWIADEFGNKLIDFAENNLHLVGYSIPFQGTLSRSELEKHLYSLPGQPDAIPYVTSYYEKRWGFSLSQKQRRKLGKGPFKVMIDADLSPGSLSLGELIIPGKSEREVLLSTYICHPSMANNELSGPVVATGLARWLRDFENRKFTYRVLFLPETIGAIAYLARHLQHLRESVVAGWVLTCMGDDNGYSLVPSRRGDSLPDLISRRILSSVPGGYKEYSFLDRGSDERQWCAPGVDLPVCSVMRSKYGTYPEYHTSLDNLDFISPDGLEGSFEIIKSCIEVIEKNVFWVSTTKGEPQMGKRGLYPNTSHNSPNSKTLDMMNVLAWCDGLHDIELIRLQTGLTLPEIGEHLNTLSTYGLIVDRDLTQRV